MLLEQLWLHDTGEWGLDIQSVLGPAEATLRDSLIESTELLGVLVDGAEAVLHIDRSAVRDVHPSAASSTAIVSQLSAVVRVTQSIVERPPDSGVRAVNGSLELEGMLLRDQQRLQQEQAGVLVTANVDTGDPSEATIVGSVFEGAVAHAIHAGIASFGARAFLGASELSCNTVQLVAEPNYGTPGSIESLGSNRCFCGAEAQSCKVISASLAPPPPLE